MGTGRRYPNLSEMGMRFDFSSPLEIGRVTGMYMRIWYANEEGKTHPYPAYIQGVHGSHFKAR